jgi:serralysin
VLDGGAGTDVMRGGNGNDNYYVDSAGDIVDETTGSGTDTVVSTVNVMLTDTAHIKGAVDNIALTGMATALAWGNNSANSIVGNANSNHLAGFGGNDVLNGGVGADRLAGGDGQDFFVFNSPLSAGNQPDIVVDFTPADDTFRLSRAVMPGIGPAGPMLAGVFHAGPAAQDADDRIVYNAATGALDYDANGSAAAGVVHIAVLANKPILTASDFAVI